MREKLQQQEKAGTHQVHVSKHVRTYFRYTGQYEREEIEESILSPIEQRHALRGHDRLQRGVCVEVAWHCPIEANERECQGTKPKYSAAGHRAIF